MGETSDGEGAEGNEAFCIRGPFLGRGPVLRGELSARASILAMMVCAAVVNAEGGLASWPNAPVVDKPTDRSRCGGSAVTHICTAPLISIRAWRPFTDAVPACRHFPAVPSETAPANALGVSSDAGSRPDIRSGGFAIQVSARESALPGSSHSHHCLLPRSRVRPFPTAIYACAP
ncbi:hypothetical protein ACFV8T_14405 [Streptomyces sp. NPDC059832]|uniref:hypothetical protein n=1 Tax=Streptomyces sp. NPDC059832 TaxID=3346966 RepID=UPI0036691988